MAIVDVFGLFFVLWHTVIKISGLAVTALYTVVAKQLMRTMNRGCSKRYMSEHLRSPAHCLLPGKFISYTDH